MGKILNFLAAFFLLAGLLFVPKYVLAADSSSAKEFSTSYDVAYEVEEDASTQVTQKIILKNLTSQYYASDFTLSVGSTSVTDVQASNDQGVMSTKTQVQNGKTVITINLGQQVAGINKTQAFTLKYKSKDFAEVVGKVWNINLPRLPEGANIDSYNVVVSSPVSLGDPTSIYPDPKSQSQTFDRLFYTFDKDQLTNSGISLSFGETQVFDFTLKQHLSNTSLFPLLTSVALPPDTAYQSVVINRLEPQPINVTVDKDGNYLAWYRVPRRSEKEITIIGSAKLYLKSRPEYQVPLTPSQEQSLTKADRYWETTNPSVQAALREIFKNGPVKGTKEQARLIYQYVVSNLKYDSNRFKNGTIERLGAATVLSNPNSAVCMEFTDLFIALARADGIPARELDGYAYSQNPTLNPLPLSPNLLHSWPEYWDADSGWVMVDPTWENTSGGIDYFNHFDLNHLVLAVKGESSQSPLVSDDVQVNISQGDFVGKSQLNVSVDTPQTLWAGFPEEATVKVANHGNAVQDKTTLNLATNRVKILGPTSVVIGPIPPFGSATVKVDLRTPDVFQSLSDTFNIEVAGQKISQPINVKPVYLLIPLPYIFVILTGIIVLLYGTILGIHIIRSRKNSL